MHLDSLCESRNISSLTNPNKKFMTFYKIVSTYKCRQLVMFYLALTHLKVAIYFMCSRYKIRIYYIKPFVCNKITILAEATNYTEMTVTREMTKPDP